jgi:hypothetical protein
MFLTLGGRILRAAKIHEPGMRHSPENQAVLKTNKSPPEGFHQAGTCISAYSRRRLPFTPVASRNAS